MQFLAAHFLHRSQVEVEHIHTAGQQQEMYSIEIFFPERIIQPIRHLRQLYF